MRRLRVASFNILHGVVADGLGRIDLDVLVRATRGLDADVLALQEVDVGVPRSGRVDQASFVADALGMDVVFGKAARVGGIGKYGNALLARGPITEVDVVTLPRTARRNEPRSAIVARVALDGLPVTVVATHLSIHRPEVHRQLDAALDLAVGRAGPRLVIGDCNLGADEVAPSALARGLALADPTDPTYPRTRPRARIDHVLVDDGFEVAAVEVVMTDLSDHCALVVEVDVRQSN